MITVTNYSRLISILLPNDANFVEFKIRKRCILQRLIKNEKEFIELFERYSRILMLQDILVENPEYKLYVFKGNDEHVVLCKRVKK